MKSIISVLLLVLFAALSLFGCSDGKAPTIKVGLVTMANSLDDGSYNSLTLEGLKSAAELRGCTYEYSVPISSDTEGFISAAEKLYSDGCRLIIFPHAIMSDAVSEIQAAYKDCKFVCLGFSIAKPASNTVCVNYSQLEAGFIAGIAAASELQNGAFGGIFGMDVSSSRRYSYGFQYGVTYANANLSTNISIDDSNMIFIGSYNDSMLAEKLAEQMYLSGVNCIVTDGQNTSVGVYSAAKNCSNDEQKVYVAGFEPDSISKGISVSQNVTVVSVVGLPFSALSNVIKSCLNKTFQGGKTITLTAKDSALGLHPDTAYISQKTYEVCQAMLEKLENGSFVLHDPTSLLN